MKIQEKKKYTLRKMPPTTVFDRSVRRAEIRKQHKKGKNLDIKKIIIIKIIFIFLNV